MINKHTEVTYLLKVCHRHPHLSPGEVKISPYDMVDGLYLAYAST